MAQYQMLLFHKIKRYLSAPAYTVNSNYHTVALALAVAVYLILAVLQPFGISEGASIKYVYLLGFAVITYVGSVIPTAIMYRVYKSEVEEGRFSKGKSIALYFLSVLLIMIGNFLYFCYLSKNTPLLPVLWAAIWQTLIISVLVFGVCLAFDNVRLQREIERVRLINERLSQKISSPKPTLQIQSDKNTDLQIDTEGILYIESDKNYCRITTANGTSVLRSTLTTLENQLKPCGHVIRCHRAFLVNLLCVEGILGSASSGYKLKIKEHDSTVPVSRTYIGDVLGYFEE